MPETDEWLAGKLDYILGEHGRRRKDGLERMAVNGFGERIERMAVNGFRERIKRIRQVAGMRSGPFQVGGKLPFDRLRANGQAFSFALSLSKGEFVPKLKWDLCD